MATSYGSSDRSSDVSTEVVKTLVQTFISCCLGTGLLQLSVLRHPGMSHKPGSLTRMRPHVWCQALDGTTTLVYLSLSSPYGHRLSVGLRRRSSSAASCGIKDICCETDLQQLFISAADPKLWNSLPADLRQAGIKFHRFKWLLIFVRVETTSKHK